MSLALSQVRVDSLLGASCPGCEVRVDQGESPGCELTCYLAKVLWITQSFVDGLPFIVCTSPLAARCGIDICPTVRPTIAAHPGL